MNAPETYLSAAVRGTIDGITGRVTFDALDDDGHTPWGVLAVDTLSDRIRVYHEPVAQIASVTVTPDESVAALEVVPGASAGLAYVDVLLHRRGTRVAPGTIAGTWANLWITAEGWR